MVQYIYFVKCPECEDEPFDFFDDAKGFALGCLSKKPVITQTEVNRNDFGECTDSCDLGPVWSWEDEMSDIAVEPEGTVFNKEDTIGCPEDDSEFAALDNSLEDIPDNFRRPIPPTMTVEALVEEMEENEDTVECKWCNELFDKSECRYELDLGYLCPQCIAAIKSRGEELIFSESLNESGTGNWVQVNLKTGEYCGCGGRSWVKANSSNIDRWPTKEEAINNGKETYKKSFKYRVHWDVQELNSSLTESVSKVKEILGNLVTDTGKIRAFRNDEKCPKGFKFLSSNGTDGEVSYNGTKYAFAVVNNILRVMTSAEAGSNWSETLYKESLTEAPVKKETIDLEYDDLTITIQSPKSDVDDWDEVEHTGAYVYSVDKFEVEKAIWEYFITEEDAADVPGGLDALEDDNLWNEFLGTHFDSLFDKYYNGILDHFRDEATQEFEKTYSWSDYQTDLDSAYVDEGLETKSMLEELEDADSYSKRLQLCPECGETSFDPDTGFCIRCGLNV